MSMRMCTSCGNLVSATSPFCPNCGARMPGAAGGGGSPRSGPSVWKILLAILLGLLAVPVGALGFCATCVALGSASQDTMPFGIAITLAVAVGAGIFILCMVGVVWLVRG